MDCSLPSLTQTFPSSWILDMMMVIMMMMIMMHMQQKRLVKSNLPKSITPYIANSLKKKVCYEIRGRLTLKLHL